MNDEEIEIPLDGKKNIILFNSISASFLFYLITSQISSCDLLFSTVISCHGKDCEALSMALESKTLDQCWNFFTNYGNRSPASLQNMN